MDLWWPKDTHSVKGAGSKVTFPTHKDGEIRPVKFAAEKSGTVYLCGCKRTANTPHCDGSHKDL